MSEEEDFDIVPDDERRGPRTWLWVSVTAAIALFAFGVGVAFMILSDRMGPSTPTATPDLSVIPATQVAIGLTATATVAPSTTITASRTPSATPTLTPSPTLTPTPTCTQAVEGALAPLYSQSELGCPVDGPAVVWAAYQPFERGHMLWRSDRDTSYVFYSSGTWFPITEGWDGGPLTDRGAAPAGLQAPQRGFGFAWSRNDDIFNGLGWARDQEKGFCALVQDYEHGYILQSNNAGSCTPENLYNFAAAGDWTPLQLAALDNSQWRATAPVAVSVPANTPVAPAQSTPLPPAQSGGGTASTTGRPAPNGIFDAHDATGFVLDGIFDEWPANWIPMNAIVYGADKHTGPGDLSGRFQVGWNADGLMLAVNVNDDIYRAGPSGTDLWKGDSIEVQFDRQLAEDLNTTTADGDDYQVGLAFDNNLASPHGYLWLPFDHETELTLPSAITINDRGYQVEFIVPWYVFDFDSAPASGSVYGFNISISDNDSEGNSQETVLSASPARLVHNNPTQWGTLRLLP